MSDYRRPTIPVAIYRDEHGDPMEYGNRWRGESPPEDAYSRLSHLERFAPLHDVALALIEWLRNTYDVDVEQHPGVVADFRLQPSTPVHAVRLVPRSGAAAPLTFVLTGFPGVYLHAGALHDFHFPACGCDACDDNVADLLDELEWTVLTVASGGYSESFGPGRGGWIEYRLDGPEDGMQSERTSTRELPDDRVLAARAALPASGQWLAWPLRPPGQADVVA